MSPAARPGQSFTFHVLAKQSRRSACDRCRDQKLRCVYQDPRIPTCERCLRGKVPCTYNHVNLNTRSKKQGTETRRNSNEQNEWFPADIEMALDLHGEQQVISHSPPSNISTSSGPSISNITENTSPQEDWPTSLEFDEAALLNLEDLPSASSIDFSLSESSEPIGITQQQQSCHPTAELVDLRPHVPKEDTVQKFHALDLRVCKILGAFESLQHQFSFGYNFESQPISELLNASQTFIDLLISANGADGTSCPGIMLVATTYTRLLSAYNELFAFMISNLPASTPGHDLPSCFGPSSGRTANDKLALLCLGVDFRLIGVNVQDDVNLNMRILLETCTYMLDKLEGHFHSPTNSNSWTDFIVEPDGPKPSVLDLVAVATRHDDWVSKERGKTPISSIRKNVQHLKRLLRAV